MTKPAIYAQHEKAFARVTAYVVMNGGERVATIAFKYPADGAGRLYAYVHWLGTEMVRGYADGGGYDKHSAACSAAAHKMQGRSVWDNALNNGFGGYSSKCEPMSQAQANFRRELLKDDGYGWDRRLMDAGFTVLQAV